MNKNHVWMIIGGVAVLTVTYLYIDYRRNNIVIVDKKQSETLTFSK